MKTASGLARGRFTLVELLVVTAIIIILAAILFPALGKVRAQAGKTVCSGNLRQLGASQMMYWNDNNGLAMDWLSGPTRSNGWYDDYYGPLKQGGYIPRGVRAKGSILDCAGVPDSAAASEVRYYTKYAYGASILWDAQKVERVTAPSRRVIFACCWNNQSDCTVNWDDYNLKLYPAHNKSPNFVFVDGHAAWFAEPTYGSSATLFRSWFHTTGRFD
jgi:prepilin-type processing-associated H-X9-DG protein